MKSILIAALALATGLLVFGAGERTAAAYPQFQLSRDQACTNCHVSPAGGGLLNENGLNVAEGISQWGTKPEFMYKKLDPPSWLLLGGDARGLFGYFQTPFRSLAGFPMQLEVYANAVFGAGLSFHVTAGIRPPETGNKLATLVWSREHYVMWQQHPDEPTGLYARLGHFLPVFGLRLAEHEDYTRRYAGVGLDTEPYGAAVEMIDQTYEAHLSGFVRDRLIDAASVDSGVALYAEARPTTTLAFGAEAMATASKDDYKQRAGLTNKVLLPGDLLIETELIGTRQDIRYARTDAMGVSHQASEIAHQVAGYVLGSKFLNDWLLLDVGLGYFNENVRYKGLDREAFDVNLHWFSTSHVELVLNTRLELIDFHQAVNGRTSPVGAYAALQLHYRL